MFVGSYGLSSTTIASRNPLWTFTSSFVPSAALSGRTRAIAMSASKMIGEAAGRDAANEFAVGIYALMGNH